jgi:O-antigen/teichoic acid export membrane protein
MTTVRRSILFSFAESYLGIVINLIAFTLLARLLTPHEVGLYSVTLAIISITQVIRDFGLVNFLIQKDELDDSHIATAWALALLLGSTLFLLVQLAAPAIAAFYKEASVTGLVRIIACNFLVLPFNSVCLALLRRHMQFPTLMRVNLTASVLSMTATLLLAWQGFGAYALALGAVLNSLVVGLGLWQAGAATQLRRPALTHWRELLRFGGPLTVANVVTSVAMDISDLAMGKMLGFDSVALASRAQGLMNLFHKDFMNAVRNVAYPAFANVKRSGQALEAAFIASVTNVTAVAWTFYGFAALFPLEVLRLMFGPQWDRAAPLVPFFCLAGAASATVNLVQTLMLAAGNARLVATAELLFQPVRAAVLCLVIYHYRELRPFAIGFLLVSLASVPYFYAFKQLRLPTDFRKLARALGRDLALALFSLAPSLAAVTQRPAGQALPYSWFFLCAAATCLIWPLTLWWFKHPLYFEGLAMLRARLANRKLRAG